MTGGNWPTNDPGLLWVFAFGLAFGYLGLLSGGIPIIMALRRLQRSLFVLALLLESTGGIRLAVRGLRRAGGASVACCFGLIAGVENLRGGTTAA